MWNTDMAAVLLFVLAGGKLYSQNSTSCVCCVIVGSEHIHIETMSLVYLTQGYDVSYGKHMSNYKYSSQECQWWGNAIMSHTLKEETAQWKPLEHCNAV
jgi:hypothetical protein